MAAVLAAPAAVAGPAEGRDGRADRVPVSGSGRGAVRGDDDCPSAANADQADLDEDEVGDACDAATGPPQRKEQCDAAWERFTAPAFKNHGDCVSYVRSSARRERD